MRTLIRLTNTNWVSAMAAQLVLAAVVTPVIWFAGMYIDAVIKG